MQQDCPECLRLWNEYLESRRQYAAARRELDGARAADHSIYKAAVERHNEALEKNDRLRIGLAGHEDTSHAQLKTQVRA